MSSTNKFGEVGRCLLSSTMMGNSRGIEATVDYFAPYPEVDAESRATNQLRKQIMAETEIFLKYAKGNNALLETKLEQLKCHNNMLRKRSRKRKTKTSNQRQNSESELSSLVSEQTLKSLLQKSGHSEDSKSNSNLISRWASPQKSKYDSDTPTADFGNLTSTVRRQRIGRNLLKMSLSVNRDSVLLEAEEAYGILSPSEKSLPISADDIVAKKEIILLSLEFLKSHLEDRFGS